MSNRSTHFRPRPPRPARPGLRQRSAFTFVELMIGVLVSSLVLSTVSVFVFGVADSWQNSESGQSVYLIGNLAVTRIDSIVRRSAMIDPNTTNGTLDNSGLPASCMLWSGDTNGDGSIQMSELTLLQYDPTTQTVYQYTAPSAPATVLELPLPTASAFKTSPYAVKTPLARNVTACEFYPVIPASSTGQRPSLEVILIVSDGKAATTVYSTATVRSPNGSPI